MIRWVLCGAGFIILAGCATEHHEVAPARATEAVSAPPPSASVQQAPIMEMADDLKSFMISKRGKEILVGAGCLIIVMFASLGFFRIIRGRPVSQSRTPLQ
jgi:hypothetical protein